MNPTKQLKWFHYHGAWGWALQFKQLWIAEDGDVEWRTIETEMIETEKSP
jgi:hypothetical protein